MSIFHIDFETSSVINIRKFGGYRYAEDDSTSILIMAIARDEEPVVTWSIDDYFGENDEALELLKEAIDSESLLYAHNAQFEHAVCRYQLKKQLGIDPPPIERWRCTAAMSRRAAAPPSLAGCAEFLQLESGKDKKGDALIRVFSNRTKTCSLTPPKGMKDPETGKKPLSRKSVSPILEEKPLWDWLLKVNGEDMTVEEAWEAFIEYCRQDVAVEREIHKRLKSFEFKGAILDSFLFNMRMNDRGIPINKEAVEHAHNLVLQYQDMVGTRFQNITGYTVSQTARVLIWMQDNGYHGENLQAGTVERILEKNDMTEEGREALRLMKLLKFAALKKFPTMLASVCKDGTIKGCTLWHGARTGRAAGRILQPQNMKKATEGLNTALAYDMICDGEPLWVFIDFWESPLDVIASCARHFIQHPEHNFLDADYSGIEARVTPWLAGDEKKLQSILDGIDQYKAVGSQIFNKPIEEITKKERTISKPVELGCCFGVGARGLQTSLRDLHKTALTLKECKRIVKIYRTNHSETVDAWGDLENAAKAAIKGGKTSVILQDRVEVSRKKLAGIRYLAIRLPSGRHLLYPHPRIKRVFKKYTKEEMQEEPWKEEKKGYKVDEIRFWGQPQNKTHFNWIATWGSRLLENCVQAIAADMLEAGCVEAEKKGYDIFAVIHDQALSYAKRGKEIKGFMEALCFKHSWAGTFPLEADGSEQPYYTKD